MHWLKEFRRNYRRKDGSTGITRKEFVYESASEFISVCYYFKVANS